jgi:glycosyltransferase involved in cell wall biosynthesis
MMHKDTPFFLDVTSLVQARHYAGIHQVGYQILAYLYQHRSHTLFCMDRGRLLSRDGIETLLTDRSNRRFGSLPALYLKKTVPQVRDELLLPAVGFYSSIRRQPLQFGYTLQMAHDLTPLLFPEFHPKKTATQRMYHSFTHANLVVCVSQSTQDDLMTYFQLPPEKLMVSHLAAEPPPVFQHGEDRAFLKENDLSSQRYILVLGTVEPRKNIQLLLEVLQAFPEEWKATRFVFVGQAGWGSSFESLCKAYGLAQALETGFIQHLGYVEPWQKSVLLTHASYLIYPSLYEGFGLPILEALTHGCPVITSISSSMPEVGGSAALYINPLERLSLHHGMREMEARLSENRQAVVERCLHQAAQFSWDHFMQNIMARIPPL